MPPLQQHVHQQLFIEHGDHVRQLAACALPSPQIMPASLACCRSLPHNHSALDTLPTLS